MKKFLKRNKWAFFCGGMVWIAGLILLMYALIVGEDYMPYETTMKIETICFVMGIIIGILARILFTTDEKFPK